MGYLKVQHTCKLVADSPHEQHWLYQGSDIQVCSKFTPYPICVRLTFWPWLEHTRIPHQDAYQRSADTRPPWRTFRAILGIWDPEADSQGSFSLLGPLSRKEQRADCITPSCHMGLCNPQILLDYYDIECTMTYYINIKKYSRTRNNNLSSLHHQPWLASSTFFVRQWVRKRCSEAPMKY